MESDRTQHIRQALQENLDSIASQLTGCFHTVVSHDRTIFSSSAGPLDVLDPSKGHVKDDTIIWLSSATRLIIAIAYLQLVDRKLVDLNDDMCLRIPELGKAAERILTGFDTSGEPRFESNSGAITLAHLLSGTSGFGPDYDPLVHQWKVWTSTGGGQVNSCLKEHLVNIPPIAKPGEKYQYAPDADWLAYAFPTIAGCDIASWIQEHICDPLGLVDTTFYPFDAERSSRRMPISWFADGPDGTRSWTPFTDQMPVHKMPQRKEEMEYPSGSGLYSTAREFGLILQNILCGVSASRGSAPRLLSDASYSNLFRPALAPAQCDSLVGMMNGYAALSKEAGDLMLIQDDVNSGLACVPLYTGRGPKAGWGRGPGSIGWGGAAGTDFFIDPVNDIASIFTTQVLPGSSPVVKSIKKQTEQTLYRELADHNVVGTLYCYPGSNRERRIQAVAALSGVRIKHVDVDHAFTQTDEYRRKWQMGSAPAFEADDGLCLNDSGAISMYVADRARSPLIPETAKERAESYMWCSFADSELSAWLCLPAGMNAGFIHREPHAYKFFWDRSLSRLGTLQARLEGREWLVGDRISLADVFIASALDERLVAGRMLDTGVRQQFPDVWRHYERVTSHPVLAHVYANKTALVEKRPADKPYEGPDFMSISWWRT